MRVLNKLGTVLESMRTSTHGTALTELLTELGLEAGLAFAISMRAGMNTEVVARSPCAGRVLVGADAGAIDRHQCGDVRVINDTTVHADRGEYRRVVPSVDQRRCRSQTDCHAPSSGGTSRQGAPIRSRHAICFQRRAMVIPRATAPPRRGRHPRLDHRLQRIRNHSNTSHSPTIKHPQRNP